MMLKKIPAILSPELLKTLAKMGHGDEISIVDGNYPAESAGPKVIRADGLGIPEVLSAILELLPLDNFVDTNVYYMDNGKKEKPTIWEEFDKIFAASGEPFSIKNLDRFDYYDQAQKSVCIVATSETALYSNVILKKGVIFPE